MSSPTPGSFLKEHDGFVLKLKIKSPDGTTQIRRVRLPRIVDASGNVSFQELVGLCVTFTVPEGSPANYQVTLTYFDVDEDTITIASTDELVDAIEQFSEVKILRVATEVKAKPASPAYPAECARTAKPVPACKRKGHGTHGRPSLQEPDPIPPQVHKVLKSFVGILSHAVNHVQEGLAHAPPAVVRQSGPAPVNSAHAGPFPAPTPSAPLDPTGNFSSTEVSEPCSPFIHFRHTCDGCHTSPIIGRRFRAIDRPDFDLCERCAGTTDVAGLSFEETVSEGDRLHQPAFRFAHRFCQPEAADSNAASDAAAEPEPPTSFIHGRHTCDSCLTTPIVGKRYHAVNLPDYDLCEKCHTSYTGTSVSFMEAELDRDRPFQARWQRRHEKMEKFQSRKERLNNARNRCENRRCRGGQALGRDTPSTPMPTTSPPTVPVCVGELNETSALSENRTYEFDDALKEAIRRSLKDIVTVESCHLIEGSQTFESPSSPPAANDNMVVETGASANEPINPEESVILTEPEESLAVHLSLEDTKAMEDAMETDSVDSEKLLSESEETFSPITIERSDTQFSKDASFASEAAGSGDVAEAVGTTLDLVAGMITDMLLEADIPYDTPTPGENLEEDPKHHVGQERTSSEEGEWLVVEQGEDTELNMPDEEIARAAEMLGSALFNSITREPDDEQASGDHMSNLSDSFSLPSTVPSINVADSQRARWATQLEQLRELGFDDESKCVDILERLQAANIGVESEEDITVTHVVNKILEGK